MYRKKSLTDGQGEIRIYELIDRSTYKLADRKTDKLTDRWIDRQTYGQKEQTGRLMEN